MNALLHYWAYDWRVILGIYTVCVAFFGSLTVHSFLKPISALTYQAYC